MRNLSIFLLFLSTTFAVAQKSYSKIIENAKALSKDETNIVAYQKSLLLYDKAFLTFADSIEDRDLYDASLIASNLKDFDKAFNYLTPLSEIVEDEEGYPGWDYIVGDYADEDYKNLKVDSRWTFLEKKARENKVEFFRKLKEDETEFFDAIKTTIPQDLKNAELLNFLKNSKSFKPKAKQDYSISFKISDSLQTSYFVHLPPNYNPSKKHTLLFFLHGAVRMTEFSEYETKSNLKYWNRFYPKFADQKDVILIFPKANKEYNWMLSDKGFFMIPEILKQLKTTLNIDDNKVFIAGHSNGATGTFSYLMKQPTQFAGFYGFNTEPRVYTGGTFIENISNRSFTNFSTDQDYYYPTEANDSFTKLAASLDLDYKEYRINGFPHWFPKFDESEPYVEKFFLDIEKRERNPFPKKIVWEFDDDSYGNIDWLSDIKLDSLRPKQQWHKEHNFKISKWLKYENDSLVSFDVDRKAFDFPRKSGKVIAEYDKNTFRIETSRVGSFKIYISPEMVTLKKKVKVYVNGKLYFNKKVKFDNHFMLDNFAKNNDSQQLWINFIELTI